ncbi:MAG: hypothetical protein OEX09_06390 [Candidatus Bathyarchaeota archaeon]|nr:hypothetical protein [Candidatus Bathyarchaeota archaeon]
MRKIRVGRHFIPFWLIVSILIPCAGSGVLASYLWPNITIPFEVKEPIQILNYTSELSLFPGETKYINVTVQNHASINYNVTFEFQLSEPTYQTTYVTFSDEIYTVDPGEQQLAAWAKVDQRAPAVTCSLTIDLKRVDKLPQVSMHVACEDIYARSSTMDPVPTGRYGFLGFGHFGGALTGREYVALIKFDLSNVYSIDSLTFSFKTYHEKTDLLFPNKVEIYSCSNDWSEMESYDNEKFGDIPPRIGKLAEFSLPWKDQTVYTITFSHDSLFANWVKAHTEGFCSIRLEVNEGIGYGMYMHSKESLDVEGRPRLFVNAPIVPITPPEPCAAAGSMWIEPSTVTLSTENIEHRIGYRFNVTVWVNLTVTCASWEFVMLYNKAHLNAVGCDYTLDHTSQFFENITTIPLIPSFTHHNSTHDLVLHAECWGMVGSFRNPGYGSLAWVEFEVVAEPAPGETLTSLLSISALYPYETYVQKPDQNEVSLCVYNCRYTFSSP